MPRQTTIQTNWTKGEVSPLARGRVDVTLYANGAKTVENFLIRPQGPVFRRSGTKFVRSTRFPTQEARIIPFTVSDTTAYELEFGAGYIHFYKNKEPLFNTTSNNELDFFTIENNGGLIQVVADDHNSTPLNSLPNWTATGIGTGVTSNGGLFRLTFTTPHTLRTGQLVYAASAGYGAMNAQYTVTRISAYIIDLQASTYDAAATVVVVYSHGVMAGDKFYISGATNYASLTNKFHFVKSVENYYKFTIANVAYSGNAITGIADNGAGLFRITSTAHGKATNDNITISDASTFTNANGSWNITVIDVDTFDLDSSTFAGTYSAGATWVPYPTTEEAHTIPIEILTDFTEAQLPDIRFAQSNDVLYIVHPDHPPQKLMRLTDDGDRDDWLLADVDFLDGPYLPYNDLAPNVNATTPENGSVYRDVYFEISSYAHTATVKAAVAFAGANADDNLYIEYKEGDQWRLARLGTDADGLTTATVTIFDNVMLALDETTILKSKNYTPGSTSNSSAVNQIRSGGKPGETRPGNYTSGGYRVIDPRNEIASNNAIAAIGGGTGVITSQYSNTFAAADVGKYIRVRPSERTAVGYWVQITGISGTTDAGAKATHSAAVTMASNNATGKFVISAHSRTCTITAKQAGATFAAFASTDVGRHMRLGFAGKWTWGIISAYTSSSQVTLTLYEDIPRDPNNAAAIAGNQNVSTLTSGICYDWRMGAWSATTGYPQAVCFHEQRLWFGATDTTPSTFWGSVTADFENFLPTELDSTVLDDSAVTYTLGSTRANAIKWMLSGVAMTIGTSGGEWQVRAASSVNDPLTPSNIKATEYTSHGAKGSAIPCRAGSSILFVDRSGEKVQELFYSYEKDAVDSDDLTVISEHILREHGGAIASAYQQKPHSIFWVLCADGTLAALTFNKKQEVVAWHHHEIAGADVEDISVIPSEDGSEDELWMICARTISSTTKRYVEVLESDYYRSGTSRLDMRFLDSHIVIDGWTSTAISGLNHLEGITVTPVVDGVALATEVVSSGAITLDSAATSEVVIGVHYDSVLESLPPEGGSQFGTSQGATKRIIDMAGRFYDSINVSFGPDSSNLLTQNLPAPATTTPWFTGTYDLVPTNGYATENGWYIKQASPYPLNILFVTTRLETNE